MLVTGGGANNITSSQINDGAITNDDINAAAGIALSKLATDPLARANHTGNQPASTISDFSTAVPAAISAVEKINIDTTEVTFTGGDGGNGAGVAKTCFSKTIPANTLGTNNGVRFKVPMTGVGTSGGASAISIAIKLGGTTYVTLNLPTASNAISGMSGFLEGYILGDGATNTQKIIAWCDLREGKGEASGDASIIIDKLYSSVTVGAGAKDSTGALAFEIAITMVNNAQNNGVIEALILEQIK